ncbi:HlyD family efflux transporter periplasmic adaptor subunit [Mariniblastus sp.]|nr:HlyD family efflux transporter periplasmic adaptor subunit [Mariniblastus sp.]
MTQTSQPIPTPVGRKLSRGIKQWLPSVAFVLMCAACLWLSQFQGQTVMLTGEVEARELIISSPQAGIVNAILPELGENTDPVYSNVSKGQLIVRLDDGSVRQTLDELQSELLSLSRSVDVELARIDSSDEAPRVPVSAKSASVLSGNKPADDQDQKLANELQAWRLGAATIERQLKQVELARLKLNLRQANYQGLTSQRVNSPASTTGSVDTGLVEEKGALEMAVAKLNTDLAFDGTAQTNRKLLSSVDESGLSVAVRSLFRSMRRRCDLLQSRFAATQKLASSLDILSPVDGQIDGTHVQPLQLVEPGAPIVSMIPSRETYAIGYARENSAIRPVVGMSVALRSHSDPSLRFTSMIESVGPKIESIPSRHRINPRVEEWGRPVRIPIPEEMAIEPGSSVSIELVVGKNSN